jgi:cytochrome d ubiquinol oxidase subunit II
MGALTVTWFALHGGLYALMKTDGELHEKLRRWTNPLMGIFFVLLLSTQLLTLWAVPYANRNITNLGGLILSSLHYFIFIPIFIAAVRQRYGWALVFSCLGMALMMSVLGTGMFPNMVLSNPDPAHSLTIDNAASSQPTLAIMLVIALIGMPLVLAYSVCIHRVFRGKVKLDTHSY